MKKTLKTFTVTTLYIGLISVVKQVRKRSYSAIGENSITTITTDGKTATYMRQTPEVIRTQRLIRN